MAVNWAAIANIVGGGLAASGQPGGFGNFGMGAQQGAQGYQAMQADQMRRKIQEQQLALQQEEAEARRVENQRNADQDAAWQKWLTPDMTGIPMQGPTRPDAPQGFQTAASPGAQSPLTDLTPEQRAYLSMAGRETGMNVIGDRLFNEPEAEKLPSDVQEYNFAKQQGYPGSFLDFQKELRASGASNTSTTINNKDYGTIPPGFRLVETPQGVMMEAIPGSPAASEAAAAADAGANKTAKEQQTGSLVIQDIDRAMTLIDKSTLPTTGFVGEKLSAIGGTGAGDLSALLTTVKANAGFAELQAMRDSSPTGGALGQVTERELAFLQATIGSLDQSQSSKQLKDNLRRVKNVYLDIIHGQGKGPAREKLGFEAPAADPDGYTIEEMP